ncbi:MAG: hypothetical protein L6277_14230 [Desulfobacterales bacterium]|nr:hypothetical protein [Pseudomonadota bacterium]MCG2773231.1 hypothetical protein [Desulfobacterales bacterium]
MRRQLRLPGFQKKQPGGGEVETGRAKKGKKAGWHLTLGIKDVIFAGIGLVGLLMMSFALGALAGRGDIYRAAYSWGLLTPDGATVAQWMPVPGPPGVAPAGTPGTATSTTVAAAVAPPPAAAPAPPTPGAAAPARPGPVTGSIAPLPPPAAAKKKGKTGTTHRDHKAREEELRQVRQEVVRKLKFQNSFDTGPKPRLPKAKDHDKAQAKSQPTQVRVAEYRTSKEAQARVAELHKKGVKATLKTTKDSKGTLYIVYKPTSSVQPGTAKIAQKPQKSSGATRKPKTE